MKVEVKTYKVYNYYMSWTYVKNWCQAQGEHLVTIKDENEWNAVKGLLENVNGIRCWMGASRVNGNFNWIDKTSFEYSNWCEGQPDNTGGNEDYLGTYGTKYLDNYGWNDFPENASQIGGFVCEFEKKEEQTEPTTDKPTEPTQPTSTEPTQPVTDKPIEPTQPTSTEPTQPVTDKPTEPTQPVTDKPTEPTSTEPTTPTETQPVTDAPTEPTTDKPTDQTQPVEKKDISDWEVIGLTNKVYTGKAITQKVAVTNGTDYATFDISYKNNVNVGNATVIIKGKGNYTGTIVEIFKITKAKNPITIKVSTKTVKLSKVKKAKQTVKPITVSKAQGKVSYKLTSVPKALKKFVKINSKGVITISKWAKAKKGTYKIKVKISAVGNKNYNSKLLTKKVTIKIL